MGPVPPKRKHPESRNQPESSPTSITQRKEALLGRVATKLKKPEEQKRPPADDTSQLMPAV